MQETRLGRYLAPVRVMLATAALMAVAACLPEDEQTEAGVSPRPVRTVTITERSFGDTVTLAGPIWGSASAGASRNGWSVSAIMWRPDSLSRRWINPTRKTDCVRQRPA
jgi:hypothetical protein